MADIFDVARLADVSVTTVSRVLNDHPSVRPRTRRLVYQAMEELGYLPNAAARGLRKSLSNTIGFVVPNLVNPPMHDVVAGVAGVVRQHGYSLLLCDSAGDGATQSANLKRLFERRVEGLIVFPTTKLCPELELFLRANIPVVAICPYPQPPGVTLMHLDLRGSLQLAVNYLSGLGHHRIGFVTYEFENYDVQAAAHRQLLSELGLEKDPSLMALVANGDQCFNAAAAMLNRPDRPSALITGRHLLAPYVLGAIRAAGLSMPGDISFLTLGDSAWALFNSPPLTVVYTDFASVGHTVAEYMFARLAGKDADELLPMPGDKFILRESCSPPAR